MFVNYLIRSVYILYESIWLLSQSFHLALSLFRLKILPPGRPSFLGADKVRPGRGRVDAAPGGRQALDLRFLTAVNTTEHSLALAHHRK